MPARNSLRFAGALSLILFTATGGLAQDVAAPDANPLPATDSAAPDAPAPDAAAPADAPPAVAPPEGAEPIKERFPGGEVRVERYVVKDEKGNFVNHGPWTWFAPDGAKLATGAFDMGKRHGPWMRKFYPGEGPLFADPLYLGYRGPFVSEAMFDYGVLNGPWIIKDAAGQVLSDWPFVAGKQEGTWTWWYANGMKRHEVTYAAGIPVGMETEWNPQGTIVREIEHIDGREKIRSREWYGPKQKHWDGAILLARKITKTKFDWYKGYADTWVVKVEGKDERVGPWTFWFPNGQKRSEGAFAADQRDGMWTWWHPNGQKWIEGIYVMGKKSGPWSWWDDKGKLEKTEDLPVITPPAGSDAVTDAGGGDGPAVGAADGAAPETTDGDAAVQPATPAVVNP